MFMKKSNYKYDKICFSYLHVEKLAAMQNVMLT